MDMSCRKCKGSLLFYTLKGLRLFILILFLNFGCRAQHNLLETNIKASGSHQPIEDSILREFQSANDLVIAYAVENFAWVKQADYTILTHNNKEWKGFIYHKNLMLNNAGTPTSITPVNVNKTACDSLFDFITKNKAWTIKGDTDKGFCVNINKQCNINDAASARLWLITKAATFNASYYAPDFFENCCPDKQRGLFLSITKKISAIAGETDATE